jgi:hypothetical protein
LRRLVKRHSGRVSNRDGLGSRVVVTAGSQTQVHCVLGGG